jgi:crotonobetainyl-CoA:carnitine CoA-transferase CaiB-like acyl-CoA transferase
MKTIFDEVDASDLGPLAGVRVVDMTSVGMGPYASQILGDMGATVIKVESPDGDVFRHAAPARHPTMGAAFLNLNRNKHFVMLNLKVDCDLHKLKDLIGEADVFVSNVRPQSLKRLGLDYGSLCSSNPRLIYCGAYGYSEAGPYAGQPAFDDIIQAKSGMADFQGANNASGPQYVNTILADKVAGLTIAYTIPMALYEREKSGLGQSIEVPMFETLVSFLAVEQLAGQTFIPSLSSAGYSRVMSPHRKPYRTLDGYIRRLNGYGSLRSQEERTLLASLNTRTCPVEAKTSMSYTRRSRQSSPREQPLSGLRFCVMPIFLIARLFPSTRYLRTNI